MTAPDRYVPRCPPRSTRHDLRGLDYHVTEWGDADAPLLVYLHGWGDTGATFQFVVDELQRDWRVVAPDWRGFGRTARAPGAYYFPDYLADLDALLAHYIPDRPATLVGHSMGANVAGLYAGTRPERVAAFVNVEGFGLHDRDPDEAPENYRRWLAGLARSPAFLAYADFDELAARVSRRAPTVSPGHARFVAQCWGRREADGTVRLRADPKHQLPNAVLYRRAEAQACWASIEARTLAIVGERSGLDEAAADFVGALAATQAGRVRISNTGHMIHFEAPGALAATIDEFLG